MNVSDLLNGFFNLLPSLLPDAVHCSQGYAVILFANLLSALDNFAIICRVFAFTKNSDRSFGNFWRIVVKGRDDQQLVGPEYTSLGQDAEEIDWSKAGLSMELQSVRVSNETNNEEWSNTQSSSSEQTVCGGHSPPNHSYDSLHDPRCRFKERRGLVSRMFHVAFVVAQWALVVAGYGQFIIGIVTYSGMYQQH